MKTILKGKRPNDLQMARGCRHVEMRHAMFPDPMYGDKAPIHRSWLEEVDCDGSCGGRR